MAKGKKDVEPNWHPNFRVTETLPDIKVIRTAFLVNFVVITIALASIGLFTYSELQLSNINASVIALEKEIAENKRADSRVLQLSKDFQRNRKIVDDLVRFYGTTYRIIPIIEAISNAVPDNMLLESIDVGHEINYVGKGRARRSDSRNAVIKVNGFLQGESTQDVSKVIEFRDKLNELEVFKESIETISAPTPRAGRSPYSFNFNITIVLKPLS